MEVQLMYDKCPQISYTNLSDKMAYANSGDPEQSDGVSTVCLSTKYFVE